MYKLEEQKIRRRTWIQAANIPPAMQGWILEDCVESDPSDVENIRKWITAVSKGVIIRATGNKSCGKGLLLDGNPGRGKTTLALSAIQEMMLRLPLDAFGVKPGIL